MPRKKTARKTTAKKAVAKKTARKKTIALTKSTKKSATKKIIMKHPEDFTNEVREKAYENYINKGGCHGDAMTDWLNAEREVKRKYSVV